MKHRRVRYHDEYHCSCGLVWSIDEDDPHPPVAEQTINELKELLSDNTTGPKTNTAI